MRPQVRQKLYDERGRPIVLGTEVARGGEGAVFTLQDRPDAVAKLYHRQPTNEKASKIAAMTGLGNERLLRLCAWPTATVHASPGGPLVGFVMPKITGHKPIFALYGPKLRLQEFPRAGWPFLIHAAANAARAFAVVHEFAHVIGDVNHGNLVIAADATVKLIDCDSFQISANGRRWFCEVGVATHQPPELQGLSSYRGVVRTPNHDRFGLAVMIFQLLFMARHPFSGRYLGAGDMPMERAIREHRFAYGANAQLMQMSPPPGSLSLDAVTRDVAALFERAFSPEGSKDGGRPSPQDWVAALQGLASRLKRCAANPGHQYLDALAGCPWCRIEVVAGFALFPVVFVGGAQGAFDVAALWQTVATTEDPEPLPPFPTPPAAAPSPRVQQMLAAAKQRERADKRAARAERSAGTRQLLAWAIAIAPFFVAQAVDLGETFSLMVIAAWIVAWVIGRTPRDAQPPSGRGPSKQERAEFRAAVSRARDRLKAVERRWHNESGENTFVRQRALLSKLKAQYDALPQERLKRLRALEADRHSSQMHAFLDRCRLDDSDIKGIGPTKKAMLLSYGIETAADVSESKVLSVPGFGPILYERLATWRRLQEKRFVFDPTRAIDPAAKAAIERQILAMKIDLEKKLSEEARKLPVVGRQVIARRKVLQAEAAGAVQELAQAEADLAAVSSI